jgi:4'-phosphopantetheinyl transferase
MNRVGSTKCKFCWPLPKDRPSLKPDDVHVWSAYLDLPDPEVDRIKGVLSSPERLRATRFYFQRDRRRFVVGRALLRTILGSYLNLAPERLRFAYGPRGKPMVVGCGDGTLRFNLSHSQGFALIAVAWRGETGVDIECIRPLLDLEEMAERCFSPRENASFRTLPASQRPEAFFTCWTRKEAYLKARGDGLAQPLDAFDVSFLPGEQASLLGVRDDRDAASRWSLWGLTPATGMVAAVAVEGQTGSLACWQWPGGDGRADLARDPDDPLPSVPSISCGPPPWSSERSML